MKKIVSFEIEIDNNHLELCGNNCRFIDPRKIPPHLLNCQLHCLLFNRILTEHSHYSDRYYRLVKCIEMAK